MDAFLVNTGQIDVSEEFPRDGQFERGERKLKKKFFDISFRCLTWALSRSLTSNKPTHYLLLYGDFMPWVRLIKRIKLSSLFRRSLIGNRCVGLLDVMLVFVSQDRDHNEI